MSLLKNNEMDKKEMIVSPGTSSNINITTLNSVDVSQKNTNGQINSPDTSSETVLGKASKSQITARISNREGSSTLVGLFTVQPAEEEHKEPIIDTDWDTDGTDYGSDESESEEEPEKVQEWRRKYEYYTEMLRKTYEPQKEERTEGTRKRNADEPSSEMSPETKRAHHHNILKERFNEAVEEANIQGFVYGVVLEDNQVMSGSSKTLEKWWNETIKFEQFGPAAADKYFAKNQENINLANNNQPTI